jgi:hypothetical protein
VGPSSHVMPKLKRDENFVNLIWTRKVSYVKGFTNVWDNQNWTKPSSKKMWKGDHFTCELSWIGNDSWSINSITFNFHFKFELCFKHVFFKIYSSGCVYVHFRIWGTTKEALIINSVKIIDKLAIIHLTICPICTNCSGTLS